MIILSFYSISSSSSSLTLFCHFSLSFIASGRSSGLHSVSSHSCCMYVRAGRPAFAWPYAGVHWSTSLMSSSLLLQQCPACLVRLTCIVFVAGGSWPCSCILICTCPVIYSLNERSGYMTLNYLMVRLQYWNFGKWGVPLHCHCSPVHSAPEW